MKRSFWTMVLVLITVSSGWALYVGAQELQDQLAFVPGAKTEPDPRYQFTDHVFTQSGQQFEIFLRLDRHTGNTWRYHASQPGWTLISEANDGTKPVPGSESRYELLSHMYRDQSGVQQEMFLRVDYIDGKTWKYQGMAGSWSDVTIEEPPAVDVPAAPQEGGEPSQPAPLPEAKA